jgi:hypothetical protein
MGKIGIKARSAVGISKVPADGLDKGPHVIIANPPAVDPAEEDRS